jgi:hypothetical protein
LLAAVAAVALAAAAGCSRNEDLSQGSQSAAPPAGDAARVAQAEKLVGRWLRPDGGYVLEVRGAKPDGRLDAAYFNPSSINVSIAEWKDESDGLHVFVELRDENYPGATYKLRYLPEQDKLAGQYFQPLLGETFEVVFVRQVE